MARLPQPGSDDGVWGEVLNEYLTTAHNSDGSLKAEAVTASAIKDNSISPLKLNASNIPIAGRVLSYNGTSFSWVAGGADPAVGGDLSGTASNAQIVNGAVDTAHLANAAVQTSKIANGAVDTAQLANAAVLGSKIANTAVDTAQLANEAVTNAKVAPTAAIDQSKIANLTTDLATKADDSTVLHNNAPNQVTLPDSSTSFLRIDIPNDGTTQLGWPDRLAFYFNGTRTGYFNQYGEIRAQPAKDSTVALRAASHALGSDVDIFQVVPSDLSSVYFGVGSAQATLTVPLSSTANITAPNIGAKVIVLADGEPVPVGTAVGTIILRSS